MSKKREQIEEIAGCVLGGSAEYRLEVAERVYDKGYRKQSGWVSVDERLPKCAMLCLVHCIHSYSCTDGYSAIKTVVFDGRKFYVDDAYEVTHWMYMPETPKMEGGTE